MHVPTTPEAHAPFEALAYAMAFAVYLRLRRKTADPVPDSSRWTVITAAVAGAALGSRILYWFEDPLMSLARWREPAYLLAGKTIVGGLIGGLFAVELAKRLMGETRSTGDLLAAPIALGLAIGRLGCFFAGLADDTYGLPTSLPWGVDFGDGIARHPTQLYESFFALALFFLLRRFVNAPHRSGDAFKAFMVAYMGWRLAIDFLKPEIRFGGLSGIQWACAGMLGYYAADIWRWAAAGREALERQRKRTEVSV